MPMCLKKKKFKKKKIVVNVKFEISEMSKSSKEIDSIVAGRQTEDE